MPTDNLQYGSTLCKFFTGQHVQRHNLHAHKQLAIIVLMPAAEVGRGGCVPTSYRLPLQDQRVGVWEPSVQGCRPCHWQERLQNCSAAATEPATAPGSLQLLLWSHLCRFSQLCHCLLAGHAARHNCLCHCSGPCVTD